MRPALGAAIGVLVTPLLVALVTRGVYAILGAGVDAGAAPVAVGMFSLFACLGGGLAGFFIGGGES